ncbi:MAG: helix-turn-helix domain-containing protein [Candidatus Levyibacteriota bacterium]
MWRLIPQILNVGHPMSKETIDQLNQVQHRLDRITPAIQQMGKVVLVIQYRHVSKTPELERRLMIFHGKKVVEEKDSYEARKREAKARKAWTADEIYRPRTFETTLNGVAFHLQKRVKVYNEALRKSLVDEVAVLEARLSGNPLPEVEEETAHEISESEKMKIKSERIIQGTAFRNLRESAGMSIRAFSHESGISVPAIVRFETGETGASENVLIGFLRVKSFKIPPLFFPDWLLNPKNEGEYLRMKRIMAGHNNADFSRKIGRSHQSITFTEQCSGKLDPEMVALYEKGLEEKIVFPDFASQKSA